jgi:hypothetical protein
MPDEERKRDKRRKKEMIRRKVAQRDKQEYKIEKRKNEL